MQSEKNSPKCGYCLFGKSLNNDYVLCSKKGVVLVDHHCSRYRYDPLKRIPTPSPPLPAFSKDDFAIN